MLLDYLGLSYQSHYDENKFKRPISVSCRPLLSSTAKTAFSIGTMWLLMCLLRIENHIFHHCWDKRRSALPVTEWSEGVNATSERPFIWVCVSAGLWRGIAVFPDCPVYISAIDLLSSWFSQMLFEAPVAVSGCVTVSRHQLLLSGESLLFKHSLYLSERLCRCFNGSSDSAVSFSEGQEKWKMNWAL